MRSSIRTLRAPTVVLLHGLLATADLNWSGSYAALTQHFRVVALDHRGHGRGIRSRGTFRLEDCADDVAAVADVLDLPTFVPVGYSMGGPIAQLMWRRHPDRVEGLVLCATSHNFRGRFPLRGLFEFQAVLAANLADASDAAVGATVAGRTAVGPEGEGLAGRVGSGPSSDKMTP